MNDVDVNRLQDLHKEISHDSGTNAGQRLEIAS
jgi:hypothetical protein